MIMKEANFFSKALIISGLMSFIVFNSPSCATEQPIERTVKSTKQVKQVMDLDQRADCFFGILKKQNPSVHDDNKGFGTNIICGVDFNRKWYLKDGQLIIQKMQITLIPREIGLLSNLTSLSLDYNNLTEIPSTICYLVNLDHLTLCMNKITKLPEEILKCTKLTYLMLEDNELTDLPEEFGTLVNLGTVGLKNNKLKNLPTSIGKLKNLKKLWLENNHLSSLPTEINDIMGNLVRLLLQGNNIDRLPFNFVYTLDGQDGVCRVFIAGNPIANTLNLPQPILAWVKEDAVPLIEAKSGGIG
jgi:hypothetical protein